MTFFLEKIFYYFPYFKNRPHLIQFFKFSIVGAIGAIVDITVYAFLTRILHLYYVFATCISVFLAILNNFILNKYWTFQKGNSGQTLTEYFKFLIVSVVNYFLNLGIFYSLVEYTHLEYLLGTKEDFLAKIIAIGIVWFSNYFANKYWTFRT